MSYLSEYKVMFRPQPSRDMNLKSLIEIASNQYNNTELLLKSKCDGLSAVDLMKSYIDDNVHIKKTKTREARYGEYFKVTINKSIGIQNLMRAVKEFIQEVIYGYPNLPYVVLYTIQGNQYFLHIWIADREWVNQVKVYRRDYWFDKTTGKPADEKDSNAILKCKKGEPRFDKNGNPVRLKWSPRKTLIFTESYEHTQPRNYDLFEAILIRLRSKVTNLFNKKQNGKCEKRVYFSGGGNREKEDLYREIASLQNYIQWQCYQSIIETYDYDAYERDKMLGITNSGINIKEPYGFVAQEIVKLYYKYRTRITKGSYHDERGKKYSLFREVSYKSALIHAVYLRRIFKKDLNQVLNCM